MLRPNGQPKQMFDVGFAEIFLLALIGLLVLGPERLPGVARTVGGFVRKARASWISLRNTIESELADAEISASIKQAHDGLKSAAKTLTDIPALTPEKPESGSIAPDPELADDQAANPVESPDSRTSKNV